MVFSLSLRVQEGVSINALCSVVNCVLTIRLLDCCMHERNQPEKSWDRSAARHLRQALYLARTGRFCDGMRRFAGRIPPSFAYIDRQLVSWLRVFPDWQVPETRKMAYVLSQLHVH